MAIENGVLHTNPALGLKRKVVRSKHLELPTLAQFAEFVAEMRTRNSRDSQHGADFAEGLAFTGCRISEAGQIVWRDLDFTAGEILVKGDPEKATKNGEIRRVPMIPGARGLFERMRRERSDEPQSTNVFAIRRCQKAMSRAAKKLAWHG